MTTLTPMDVPQSGAARRRRRAGRRRVGDRRADRATRSNARAGRSRLAVGEHVRGPRTYRGRDIHWWMDAAGVLDERYDEVDDIVRARRVPSMQLAGSPERATFDLNALTDIGVKLVGRLAGIATAARSSPGRCATSASSPTSSSAGCSTPSTSGRRPTASTTRRRRRTGSSPRRLPSRPRLELDLDQRRDPDRSSGRPASGPTTPGSTSTVLDAQGTDPPRRRRGRVARHVPDRHARSCAGASRASSTVRATTPRTSSPNSPRFLDGRSSPAA